MSKRVLIVDDEESVRSSLEKLLAFEKYTTFSAADGETALETVSGERIDLVLLDIKMPGMDGIEVLQRIKEARGDLPVVIISGHGTISTAVEATKLGAFDFLEKPIDMDRLLLTVRNGIKQGELSRQNVQLKEQSKLSTEIVGRHPDIIKILETVEQVAPTNARVLIMGENGTGKELVARKLHETSKRSAEPFIEVNCAAIPEDLIESALFGHEKGSFTGAVAQRIGKFEVADGGTLFLDEVGDMSLSAQAKVLRVLQESTFERVGGTETKRVDVRVIAATNKDLLEAAADGKFREDLFYRLNVVPINIPPLRERKSDIPALLQHFIHEKVNDLKLPMVPDVAPGVIDRFLEYAWPGNVRELANVVEREIILNPRGPLTFEHVNPVKQSTSHHPEERRDATDNLDAIIRHHIQRVLKKTNGKVHGPGGAAELLGINANTLRNRMNKLGIMYGRKSVVIPTYQKRNE